MEKDSPFPPPRLIKLNGRDPSKEKKVISFNPIEDNTLVGDDPVDNYGLRNMRQEKGLKPIRQAEKAIKDEAELEDI